MDKPVNPCYNCEFRRVGCHASCDVYQQFRKDSYEYKQAYYKANAGGWMADEAQKRTKRRLALKDHRGRYGK